jgi:hypothetical protein
VARRSRAEDGRVAAAAPPEALDVVRPLAARVADQLDRDSADSLLDAALPGLAPAAGDRTAQALPAIEALGWLHPALAEAGARRWLGGRKDPAASMLAAAALLLGASTRITETTLVRLDHAGENGAQEIVAARVADALSAGGMARSALRSVASLVDEGQEAASNLDAAAALCFTARELFRAVSVSARDLPPPPTADGRLDRWAAAAEEAVAGVPSAPALLDAIGASLTEG